MLGEHAQHEHVADALLHAYVAGEVDPAQRSVISSHLETCGTCRVAKARVESVTQLFEDMQAPELDEFKWKRIGQAVLTQLENQALSGPQASVFEALVGLRWPVPFAISAIIVALFIWWTQPKPSPAGAKFAAVKMVEMAMPLPRGITLRSSEDARVRIGSAVPPNLDLALDVGQLDIAIFEAIAPDDFIRIVTPAFTVATHAADFTVRYQAGEFTLHVRDGEVKLSGDALLESVAIHGGEGVVLRFERGRWQSDEAASSMESRLPLATAVSPSSLSSARRAPADRRERGASLHKTISKALRSGEHRKDQSLEGLGAPIHLSSEGETSVQVMTPVEDEIAVKWQAATRAYYQARDIPTALALTEVIVRTGGNRPEVAQAQKLRCNAYVTTGNGELAVDACNALLALESDPEDRRAVHYELGNIYRTLLNDCREALIHYSAAMVFGRRSTLDSGALVWHAHCSLELGDVSGAKRDIFLLEGETVPLSSLVVQDLKRRLAEAEKSLKHR